MTELPLWTLDELVELARAALSVDYDGPRSGRVRELPDRRLVRWYVTRGLVDRPATMRGRNAMYDRRHLLQLVAIKRRQAQGSALAEVQAELVGATDNQLERIAQLPAEVDRHATALVPAGPPAIRHNDRFWTTAAIPAETDRAAGESTGESTGGEPGTLPGLTVTPWPIRGIRLAPGVTLLVDGQPPPIPPDALRRAARPLLDLLASTPEEGNRTP